VRSQTTSGTRDQKGVVRAAIACGIGGVVAAADIWGANRALGTWVASAPLIDFAIVAYAVLVLLKLQRNLLIGTFIAVLLFVDGTVGMLARDEQTWSPVSFGDLLLLPDLFAFYGTLPLLAAGIALAAFAGLFLCNLRIPRRSDLPLMVPLLLAAGFLLLRVVVPGAAASASATHTPSRHLSPAHLGYWGALVVSIYDLANEQAEARRLRQAFSGKSLPYPDFTASHPSEAAPRNIYIILVESLFNPHEIEGVRFDREPLAPPFDTWFRRGGAHAMSPVFGGRSADAEFEILCGLPVTLQDGDVLFARLTAKQIDCLPAKLGRLGWNSVSVVPIPRTFFEAGDAYRRIGFAESIFIDRIDISDRDGQMVSAQSLLEQQQQVVARMQAKKKPFLSYVFLTSGHFPYPLNAAKRPTVIHVAPKEPMVEAYVNAAYYNMLAVGRYIEALRKADPTALIVTLGDHPPAIFLDQETTNYPGPAARTHQVPLMIFDGTAGEMPLTGWIPSYQVPEIIMEQVTKGRFCAENRCYRAEPTWIRPLGHELSIVHAAEGRLETCDAGGAECVAAENEASYWKSRVYALMGIQ
jgi:phosphoglycerol transferase MdoB-like AlkP superfamily enzyme